MLPLCEVFAQVNPLPIPDDVRGWVGIILNLGALGILGYYLLRVQPQAMKDAAAAQSAELREFRTAQEMLVTTLIQNFRENAKEDRLMFELRNNAAISENKSLKESMVAEMKVQTKETISELRHQTHQIDEGTAAVTSQTESIEGMSTNVADLVAKIADWPSDHNKICKAQQALKDLGFTDKIVEKLIAVAEHRRSNKPGAA